MTKTPEQLEAMTKAELDAYGNEALGVDLDRRRTKEALIEEILRLQAEQKPDEPVAEGEPSPEPAAGQEGKTEQEPVGAEGTVRITVTAYTSSSGVPLSINGRRFNLPINRPVTVPAWVLPTLETIGGLRFTKE